MTVAERTPAEWTPIRRAVAKRMSAANREVPQFHVSTQIRIDSARAFVQETGAATTARVTMTVLLVAAVGRALREHPRLNAVWDGEELFLAHAINVGVAIALDAGLVAPAILDADRLEPAQLAERLASLVNRAREGGLRPAELAEATFTVSNLGMFDVSTFAAIVPPPQVAILAVGSAFTAPSWTGERWEPASFIDATLSCDHRAVDGADAARFLQTLKSELERSFTIPTEVTRDVE